MRRLAIIALFALLAACKPDGSTGGGGSVDADCPVTAAIGVAVPNGWPGIDPEQYASDLADGCSSLTEIEALPWFDRSGKCDQAHPTLCTEVFREKRRAFLRAMSAHKVTTHIVSQNSNAWGPWRFPDEVYRQIVREIREDATESGLGYAWLASPSEPHAWDYNAGLRRAQIAREEWPGTFVLPDYGINHATGKPYFPGIAYDWLEVHPCTTDDAIEAIQHKGTLTVTDCGTLLNPGPDVASVLLAPEALRLDAPFLIYDFEAAQPDEVTIDAVGTVIRGQ